MVVQDRTLTSIAKRNMKDIVPLYYNMKKAKGEIITNKVLYDGMTRAFTGGNIGIYSNNITKIWNCGKPIEEEQLNVIKWLCMENNFVIDYAKTLYQPTRPTEVDSIIKSYTKSSVPDFFKYAKDKEEHQVELPNNSSMNRISAVIPTSKITYNKSIKKFDHTMLMYKDADFTIRRHPILDKYDYWVTHRWTLEMTKENIKDYDENNQNSNSEEWYIYKKIREDLLSLGEHDYVVNTLINYVYTIKKASNKKLLWACFGEEIVANLKINTASLGNICPICGKRFKPRDKGNNAYCSEECATNAKLQYDREFREKS